jgi:hypothetical protein
MTMIASVHHGIPLAASAAAAYSSFLTITMMWMSILPQSEF